MTFEETLAEWMPAQRWFAGKGARIIDLAIVADTELAGGDPGLRHLIVAVSQGAAVDTYQLLLGLRAELPDELRHVVIGMAEDGRIAYDALHDPELTRLLLRAIAERRDGRAAALRPRSPGAERGHRPGQPGAHRRAEQHQPDVRRGQHPQGVPPAVPRPQPRPGGTAGPGPARFPARGRSRWAGSRRGSDGAPTVLGILSTYLRTAADGWSLAATSVRDLYASEGTAAGRRG